MAGLLSFKTRLETCSPVTFQLNMTLEPTSAVVGVTVKLLMAGGGILLNVAVTVAPQELQRPDQTGMALVEDEMKLWVVSLDLHHPDSDYPFLNKQLHDMKFARLQRHLGERRGGTRARLRSFAVRFEACNTAVARWSRLVPFAMA